MKTLADFYFPALTGQIVGKFLPGIEIAEKVFPGSGE